MQIRPFSIPPVAAGSSRHKQQAVHSRMDVDHSLLDMRDASEAMDHYAIHVTCRSPRCRGDDTPFARL